MTWTSDGFSSLAPILPSSGNIIPPPQYHYQPPTFSPHGYVPQAYPIGVFYLPGHNGSLRLDTSLFWTNGSQVQGFCPGRGALSTSNELWGHSGSLRRKSIQRKAAQRAEERQVPDDAVVSSGIQPDTQSNPDVIG